uniref:Uncharacterized protein n=1 Tax=Tanacetum cinerariifolium TaxID=118510 RepID=A0A6L2KG32_TANCI|nr:hypothetical protein [Tanacetum cinerariifolium]
MPETMETMTYKQFKEMLNNEFNVRSTLCARCRLAECVVDGAFCTSPTRIAARKPLNPFSSSSVESPFDPVGPREGLENDNLANRIASHVTAIANGRATLSRDYILNLKDHKQYPWKAAVADSKWPSEAIRMLNVYLPGNSKLLPIEPSKVCKFKDLQALVQDEFAIEAVLYTMRYNKSRSATGWRPLTDAGHLRTLRTLINGELNLFCLIGPSEVFSLACQLFGVQWTNTGESSHSSRRQPQSKRQAIHMLNVYLPGNSKLLRIEPSKVRKFEDLQALVQDEFTIAPGSYTMRYNKSQSATGWRPLTDAGHLRMLRTLINGEWYVEVVMN